MAFLKTGNFRVDLTVFNNMLIDLAKNTGQSKAAVIDAEATAILNKTISKVPAANVARIRAYYAEREYVTYEKTRYFLKNRYPDYLWKELQTYLKQRMNQRIAGRGLAKQSFLKIGQQLRLPVEAPDYVHVATARGRPVYQQVLGTRKSTGPANAALRIYNASPLNRWVQARVAIMSAIGGRINFFVTNLKKGVFDDMRKVAAKYPGLRLGGG